MIDMADENRYDLAFINKTDIDLKEQDSEHFIIEGMAVSTSPNSKYLVFMDTAVRSAVENFQKARKKPRILIDHVATTTNVVGKVVELNATDKGMTFKADLNPNHPSGITHAIKRGDVDAVSVGGYSTSIVCSICNDEISDCDHLLGEEYDGKIALGKVKNFYLKELSITAFPADENAMIALTEDEQFTPMVNLINLSKIDVMFGPSYAERQKLPDSSFAMPKERKLPYKDANGKIVCKWVRDALRLAPKVKGGVPDSAMRKLRAAAEKCGIETEQMSDDLFDEEDSEKNSEKFIKDNCGRCDDLKMTDAKSEEKNVEKSQLEILQAALEKLSKENQELQKTLEEQNKFIQQKRAEEREEKIREILELTDLKRAEVEQYTDDVLNATLEVLRKTVKPVVEEKKVTQAKSVEVNPSPADDMEALKEKIRIMFGFPKPTERAVKKAKEISLMRSKNLLY